MRDTKKEVLKFWFEEIEPQQWFQKNESFDQEVTDRFHVTYDMAQKDLCSDWTKSADGILALCVVLDQFPRNMFRDSSKAFQTDEKALLIAKDALNNEFDVLLPPEQRMFVYMPFMHSEKLEEQERSVLLFESMKEDSSMSYDYALKHFDVIKQFGRFPHRNKSLDRVSTKAELEYLKLPNSSF